MKVQSGTNEKNKQQLYPFTIGGVKTLAFVIQPGILLSQPERYNACYALGYCCSVLVSYLIVVPTGS